MRLKEYLNRAIVGLGTPLSLVTTLATTPLIIPIALPLIFLALVVTLLLVLLALLVLLLVVLAILLKQLPQLLQLRPQSETQSQLLQQQSKSQNHTEQSDVKPNGSHVRNASTSTFSKRRPILNTPEFSHHRTGSCHESEADSMSITAPIYDFTTNGTAFGIDSPRKKH